MEYKKVTERSGLKQISFDKFKEHVEFFLDDFYEEKVEDNNHEKSLNKYKEKITFVGPLCICSLSYPEFDTEKRNIESYLIVGDNENLTLYQSNKDRYFNDDMPIFIVSENDTSKEYYIIHNEPYLIANGDSGYFETLKEIKTILPFINSKDLYIVSHN